MNGRECVIVSMAIYHIYQHRSLKSKPFFSQDVKLKVHSKYLKTIINFTNSCPSPMLFSLKTSILTKKGSYIHKSSMDYLPLNWRLQLKTWILKAYSVTSSQLISLLTGSFSIKICLAVKAWAVFLLQWRSRIQIDAFFTVELSILIAYNVTS